MYDNKKREKRRRVTSRLFQWDKCVMRVTHLALRHFIWNFLCLFLFFLGVLGSRHQQSKLIISCLVMFFFLKTQLIRLKLRTAEISFKNSWFANTNVLFNTKRKTIFRFQVLIVRPIHILLHRLILKLREIM